MIINLRQQINPFELIDQINGKLDEIWRNRSKKVIKDSKDLRNEERMKEIENLIRKEVIYG